MEENDAEFVSQLGILDGAIRPPNNATEWVHVDEFPSVINDFAPAHRIPLGRGQIYNHRSRRRSENQIILVEIIFMGRSAKYVSFDLKISSMQEKSITVEYIKLHKISCKLKKIEKISSLCKMVTPLSGVNFSNQECDTKKVPWLLTEFFNTFLKKHCFYQIWRCHKFYK